MTRNEFDGWLEQHWQELVNVAVRRGARDPEDAVQTAIAQMLTHGGYANSEQPWSWAVLYVRSAVRNARRGEQRFRAVSGDLKKLHAAGHSLGWKRPRRVDQ